MEKSKVIEIRDFLKQNKCKAIKVTSDNMELFQDNTEYVIWDDDAEILTAIRSNSDHQTQYKAPFTVISTTYENIQYIEAIFDKPEMTKLVDVYLTNGKITEKQANILKERFIDGINNFDVETKYDSDTYYPLPKNKTEEETL